MQSVVLLGLRLVSGVGIMIIAGDGGGRKSQDLILAIFTAQCYA